jgi:ribosomal-protein-alanine N-acetyltransferase
MRYTDNLESPRLITRFLTEADATAWEEYCADPIATQFTSGLGLSSDMSTNEKAAYWIGFALKRYATNRLGLQALISKKTGELIGQCGLLVQEANGRQEIEIGYHLVRRHWGKGYASEAAQLFRDYGFTHGFADSLVSLIHPENDNSKRVAMRNGMKLDDAEANFRDKSTNLYRITRSEWELLKVS